MREREFMERLHDSRETAVELVGEVTKGLVAVARERDELRTVLDTLYTVTWNHSGINRHLAARVKAALKRPADPQGGAE